MQRLYKAENTYGFCRHSSSWRVIFIPLRIVTRGDMRFIGIGLLSFRYLRFNKLIEAFSFYQQFRTSLFGL